MGRTIWRRTVVSAVAVALWLGGTARAEFVSDARGWDRLSAQAQRGYVAGVLDQTGVASSPDDRQLLIRSAAELCLMRAGISSKSIAEGVSDAYRKEPKLAKQPPFLVTWYVATRRCKSDINAELARGGLEPLDVEAILTSLKVDLAGSR